MSVTYGFMTSAPIVTGIKLILQEITADEAKRLGKYERDMGRSQVDQSRADLRFEFVAVVQFQRRRRRMALPDYNDLGVLPPGIYSTSLEEVTDRYGRSSDVRKTQADLLRHVVASAVNYPTINRVLVWGSFVTAKAEPNDLDYSIVVSMEHRLTEIAEAHRRFFIPVFARQFYGTDAGYLLIRDFPVERYAEQVDFLCHNRSGACGIVEISIWGEYRRGEHT